MSLKGIKIKHEQHSNLHVTKGDLNQILTIMSLKGIKSYFDFYVAKRDENNIQTINVKWDENQLQPSDQLSRGSKEPNQISTSMSLKGTNQNLTSTLLKATKNQIQSKD